jgi:hypothetical protein
VFRPITLTEFNHLPSRIKAVALASALAEFYALERPN